MVCITKSKDQLSKLKILGETARFDVCGYPSLPSSPGKRAHQSHFIYPAAGRGCTFRLFKVLQTNACEGNCYYCANRQGRDFPRITFEPAELARLFIEYYRKGLVDGLFLSSAISKGPDHSQEEMLRTVELLRRRYQYRGYIHSKSLPGAHGDLIKRISRLSDRVSLNLEVPGQRHLNMISPSKNFQKELLSGLTEISRFNRHHPLPSGITTQLVVGAAGETDQEIIKLADKLYQELKLRRVYYSGFTPLRRTPLENRNPCSPWREFRLYQADFLIRKYHFSSEELYFDKEGRLPQNSDPKLAWAERHQDWFPLEINKASCWELMRVPGIGEISSKRIIETRRHSKIKELEQLKRLGVVVKRAKEFITLNGKYYHKSKPEPPRKVEEQLLLWEGI